MSYAGNFADPIGKFEDSMPNCDQAPMDAIYFGTIAAVMGMASA